MRRRWSPRASWQSHLHDGALPGGGLDGQVPAHGPRTRLHRREPEAAGAPRAAGHEAGAVVAHGHSDGVAAGELEIDLSRVSVADPIADRLAHDPQERLAVVPLYLDGRVDVHAYARALACRQLVGELGDLD